MDRVFSKNLEITIPGRVSMSDLATLRDKCNDLVAVYKNDTHIYCTRKDGGKFNFRSIKSLGKMLPTINPADIQLVRTAYSDRMPDTFFRNHIDPYAPMEDQILFAKGRFQDFALILANIKNDVKKKRNIAVKASIETKGVIETYREGVISAGEVKSNLAVQAIIREKEETERNKSKDMPAGITWSFVCHKTGKEHFIESHMMEDESDQRQSVESEVEIERLENGSMRITGIKEPLVKKKHYYFYSPAGYGKTYMLGRMFSKMCNVTTANDPNNFIGARPDAQFIVIDEYGPDKRMSMAALKSLTSGNPKNSFTGNRKSYGASFVPRNDVQVVILSNRHLFYCMGKGVHKKISPVDAQALRDRFHIIKMHEGVDGTCTEEEEAACYIEPEESVSLKRKSDQPSGCETKRQRNDVFTEMCLAIAMSNEQRKEMVERCAPQFRLMLQEEIESGNLDPESVDPYERMKHVLKHKFGPEFESMVTKDTLFTGLVMTALGDVETQEA